MRILFIGGTKRGYLSLKALVGNNENVVGIISLKQFPNEKEIFESQVNVLAKTHGIPLFETKWMKELDYAELIKDKLQPDVIFVVGCRLLIPEKIYSIPRLGTLAVHDSFLPAYRGFAPMNWAIVNGDDNMGVTLFYMNEAMDDGDILSQKRIPIGDSDVAPHVYDRVCSATIDLIIDSLPLLKEDRAPRIKQDFNGTSYTCSRGQKDGYIDWKETTEGIFNKIRALAYPYPGAFTYYKNKKLYIWSAVRLSLSNEYVGRIPGKIVQIDTVNGTVHVLTGDGVLVLHEIQLENGKVQQASQLITSVRDCLGQSVVDLADRVAELEIRITKLEETQRGEDE